MTNKPIHYINRYSLPQYHSIEELFGNIQKQVAHTFPVKWIELPQSGASYWSLIKNLWAVTPRKGIVYHITGDVNYMALRLGKQAILTVHDVKSALQGEGLKTWIIKQLWFNWPARRVKFITVISEFSKAELEQLIPGQAHKIKVIPNPVHAGMTPDLNHQFNAQQPQVLLIGTKSNKNLERSLEALTGLQVKLIIIGKLTSIQLQQLEETGLPYENHKQLSFDEIISRYKQVDLLCFPSLYEGFGMPIIEAQAIGRPVLTSNRGAMKEVAGDTACLVDPNDVQAIREGVLQIIEDHSYRKRLVASGLENVKRFSLEKTIKAYQDLYKEMG